MTPPLHEFKYKFVLAPISFPFAAYVIIVLAFSVYVSQTANLEKLSHSNIVDLKHLAV